MSNRNILPVNDLGENLEHATRAANTYRESLEDSMRKNYELSKKIHFLEKKIEHIERQTIEMQSVYLNKSKGVYQKAELLNTYSCMLSILDSLKLYDNGLLLEDETLSEVMFRKMKAYNIDLNKELGFTHLKPVSKK